MRDLLAYLSATDRTARAFAGFTPDDDDREALAIAEEQRAEAHGIHLEEPDEQ